MLDLNFINPDYSENVRATFNSLFKQKKENLGKKARYVLIDDDPTYCAIMLRIASQEGVHLDVYESLMGLGSIGLLGQYDGAIVDYDLGTLTGVEIAEYLSKLFGDIPMVLVSAKYREPTADCQWPSSIRAFVHKSNGYAHVLQQALKMVKTPRC